METLLNLPGLPATEPTDPELRRRLAIAKGAEKLLHAALVDAVVHFAGDLAAEEFAEAGYPADREPYKSAIADAMRHPPWDGWIRDALDFFAWATNDVEKAPGDGCAICYPRGAIPSGQNLLRQTVACLRRRGATEDQISRLKGHWNSDAPPEILFRIVGRVPLLRCPTPYPRRFSARVRRR